MVCCFFVDCSGSTTDFSGPTYGCCGTSMGWFDTTVETPVLSPDCLGSTTACSGSLTFRQTTGAHSPLSCMRASVGYWLLFVLCPFVVGVSLSKSRTLGWEGAVGPGYTTGIRWGKIFLLCLLGTSGPSNQYLLLYTTDHQKVEVEEEISQTESQSNKYNWHCLQCPNSSL